MNRSLAVLSVLALVFAGCAAPPAAEDDDAVASSGDALSSMADDPAVVPEDGEKPKVETVDLSKVDFDLDALKDARGRIDFSRIDIDVLDTGTHDNDYSRRKSDLDLKWVKSDKHELPAFVEGIAHGIDIGGGKCRLTSLSLKKVVVGCKWTW